jgi:hypothetical protein
MEFRLTYAGQLLAHKDNEKLRERSLHVHSIRRALHKQLKVLWSSHPVLKQIQKDGSSVELVHGSEDCPPLNKIFQDNGFNWLPMVTEENGLICKLNILMLRHGQLGRAIHDVGNRLKTLFDALRKAKVPSELGAGTSTGQVMPADNEDPFYVLLEDDKLITDISVTTDTMLEPVPSVPPDEAVRLVIGVAIRPYRVFPENSGYA